MAKQALIIIDMLNDFIAADGALYVGDTVKKIIPAIQKKLVKARDAGMPVVYVCDNHEQDDAEFDMFPKHCVAGTKGSEVHKDLRPADGDIIIPKTRYSAFYNTDLHQQLTDLKVESLDLAGVCTNICVLYTAADARNRGYAVTVDRRCVDSFDRAAHEFALKEMDRVLGVKLV